MADANDGNAGRQLDRINWKSSISNPPYFELKTIPYTFALQSFTISYFELFFASCLSPKQRALTVFMHGY